MNNRSKPFYTKLILWFIVTCFLSPIHAVFSQDGKKDYQSILRYWYYRDRLRYFVVPGDKPGESMVAGIRNEYGQDPSRPKRISYGQHGVYMGYYMGVLATEYKLLRDNNQDTERTKSELYYALNAYIKQMDMCEQQFYSLPDKFDGFFIRYYVPHSFFSDNLDQLNEGADEVNLVWNGNYIGTRPGHPWVVESSPSSVPPEEMSQDEAIGLLLGLALVNKCLPDENLSVKNNSGVIIPFNFKSTARTIADKIVRHIYEGGWFVRNPLGDKVSLGADANFYAYGFAAAVAKMHEEKVGNWIHNVAFYYPLWQKMYLHYGTGNDWMALSLAAIGDSWENTGFRIKELANLHQWDSFYLLLWAALNEKYDNYYVKRVFDEAAEILDDAPCEGPYNFEKMHPVGGWACSYRWHKPEKEQYGDTGDNGSWFCGNYNGLDYMLLENLYLIVRNPSIKSSYNNYIDRRHTGELPRKISSFNTPIYTGSTKFPMNILSLNKITSSAKLHNHPYDNTSMNIPAHVTYKAKKSIILEPGFLVEPGAYFNTILTDIDCTDFMGSN